MTAPTQQDLARALGVHASVITRDKARGMPVHSIEAARSWRAKNRRPRMKMRATPAAEAASQTLPAMPTEPDPLAYARELAAAAHVLLLLGLFAQIEPELRQALQDVPVEHRPLVIMPLEVWDALTAEIGAGMDCTAPGEGETQGEPDETVEAFWYMAAAGELVVTP
jgi:hypothetical protein